MSPRTLALSTLVLASAANAAITGVAGQTTLLGSPPVSCVPSALAGFTAYAWNEKQNLTISSGVFCDNVPNPGGNIGAVPGLVTGTVDSHFIHFEDNSGVGLVQGSVTFSAPIVGVMFNGTSLDNSDVLCGAIGTTYPTLYPFRQMGSSVFSYTGNTLTFNLSTISPVIALAEIRVLTQVPAPASAALLGMGGLVALRRRR